MKIGTSLSQDELKERIKIRLDKRIKEGLIEESRTLLRSDKLTVERMNELGLEYTHTTLLLQKKISEEEFREKVLAANLQYAKRQMTWFKRDKEIKWFHPDQGEDILREVENFLEEE